MARIISTLTLLLLTATPTLAQEVIPPIAGVPEGYSQIAGKYTIAVDATPTTVHVEEPITLTIRITGSGPAEWEPKRERLRLFPDWNADFYVQELRDDHRVLKQDKTWLFVYQLRPKHPGVEAIDEIKLVYFDAGTNKFATRYGDRIPITVKPRKDEPPEVDAPSTLPESLYQTDPATFPLGAAAPPPFPGSALYTSILIAPPLMCLFGFFLWRRMFSGYEDRQARLRARAAERALAQLDDRDARVWEVLRAYLHERFGFAVVEPTPADVAAFLKRGGFANEVCAEAMAFVRQCDVVRFTGSSEAKDLAAQARNLILAMEGDPCAR